MINFYENKQIYKYILSSILNLEIDNINNLQQNQDNYFFDYNNTHRYEIDKNIIDEHINTMNNVGVQEYSKQRIAILATREMFEYFLSTHYLKYNLILNFIKMCNYNNYGVDIITDGNISNVIPNEMKNLDIKLYFDSSVIYDNKLTYQKDSLQKSLFDYISCKKSYEPIKIIANNNIGLEILNNEKQINNTQKALLLHTQEILECEYKNRINDDEQEILDLLYNIKYIDFDVIVTSEELLNLMKRIDNTKNYILINEAGYNLDVVKKHAFNTKNYFNRNVLCKYTSNEDLEQIINSSHPLGYDVTILVNDSVNQEELKKYIIEEILFENFKLINEKYFSIIKPNYDVYIDFSIFDKDNIDLELMTSGKNIYSEDNVCMKEYQNENSLELVDKENIILIIKTLIVFNPEQYEEVEILPAFNYTDNVEELDNSKLKIFLGAI